VDLFYFLVKVDNFSGDVGIPESANPRIFNRFYGHKVAELSLVKENQIFSKCTPPLHFLFTNLGKQLGK